MTISLIITTYNWKEVLELIFRGLARQTEMPAEVLVADDGSDGDTAELIRCWAAKLPVPVRHLWQEKRGFRVGRARNRAIAAAKGDYIIILDGDMIMERHFIADHRRAARPGCFVQGMRIPTRPELGVRLLAEKLLDVSFWTSGIVRRHRAIRNGILSWWVGRRATTNPQGIRGCNQAYWRSDLLKVNGFDEAMVGWGREDDELAARLFHAGVKRRNLKYGGLAIHIYHPKRRVDGSNNDERLRTTRQSGLTRCQCGVDRHLAAEGSGGMNGSGAGRGDLDLSMERG